MDPTSDKDQAQLAQTDTTRDRRWVLRLLAGGGAGLIAGTAGATRLLATDDGGDGGGGGDNSGHGGGDGDDDDALQTPTVVGTAAVPGDSVEIRIVSDDSDGFQPNNVTVDLGQSITFVNTHSDEHTATGPGFDTGIIQSGGTATVVLEEAGTFAYACQIHPEMTGTVSVRNAEGEVPQDDSPEATPASKDLTGKWTVTWTASPGSDFDVLQGEMTVNDDGTLETTFAQEGTSFDFTLGPATGAWTREDGGSYRLTTAVFLLDSDQRFGGTLTFHDEIRLDGSGDAFQGTLTYMVKDPNGEMTASGEGTTEGSRSDGGAGAATPAASASQIVTIRDFAFDPPSLEVPSGTTVTWRNDGQAPHTATALDGSFDTGQLNQGQEGQFSFEQAGTYDYRCDFHPNMLGTVVVT